MYWLGRYIERAENTARLINVNSNLMLDLPGVKHVWDSIVEISGAEKEFHNTYARADERNVVRFMLTREFGSLAYNIRMARENARTTREILPIESWRQINELHLFVQKHLPTSLARENRARFLDEFVGKCFQITGTMAGIMSNDTAYQFIRIGRNLERADMTSRIVDVGFLNLHNAEDKRILANTNILWMNVLKSLSAYQMYRQHVQDRVNDEDVVDFLLKNNAFPRAVTHCIGAVSSCLQSLPNNDGPLRAIAHAQRNLSAVDVIETLNTGGLHDYIDEIQLEIQNIHSQVYSTWFKFDRAVPGALESAS